MKNTLLTLAFVCSFVFSLSAKVIFVKADGAGDGTSWKSAFGDVQQALAQATAGTEIWVAEGTYLPVQCDYCNAMQREATFNIPGGVRLYGGFIGNESSLSQRKWFAHPTKLSGDIGTESESDNSFNVVSFKNADAGTLLDGFVITGGHADAWEPVGSRNRSGGGIFNDGSGKGGRSTVELKNCVFLNNYAEEGGAIFNHGHHGEATIEIENCTFVDNKAGKGGGAIFSNNDEGFGNIDLKKCKFVKNEAGFGGAIFVTQAGGSGRNQIVSTHFVANKATAGSALFTLALDTAYQPDFFLCDYLNNVSKEGDEVYHCEETTVPKRLMNAMAMSVSERL